MIPNAALQRRLRHFDQLLERELALIGRAHEQNLLTHAKLEKSIRRESNQIKILRTKKVSPTPIDDSFYEDSEKSPSSVVNSQNVTDDNGSQIIPKYHRQCYKAQRLPSIVKFHRHKRSNNDGHWMANLRSMSTENTTPIFINEELPTVSLPELTPIQKHIQAFMDTLPANKGVQKGFDNFAAAALYSHRVLVALR